ncbi:hypothetical protein BDN67DRAFT_1069772 [Paxillus ammoniavirescens]|nr:hypothetical protein BDN67DRAFT_1069772 [Paxillus ammoniavirescens]
MCDTQLSLHSRTYFASESTPQSELSVLVCNMDSTGVDSTPPSAVTFPPINRDSASVNHDVHDFLPWLRRIRFEAEKHQILSFSNSTKALELWFWPVLESGERVPPDALPGHCQTHHFTGPGCLCSMESIDSIFTEVLIFMVTTGRHVGKWTAACATRHCRYWVFLDDMYTKPTPGELVPDPVAYGGDAEDYPPTQPNIPVSSPITSALTIMNRAASIDSLHSGAASGNGDAPVGPSVAHPVRLGKKRKNRAGDFDPFVISPAPKRQQPAELNEFALLMKLDDFSQPGLRVRQLKALFIRCEPCGLVMTRCAYEFHDCFLESEQEVIDLTGDNSNTAVQMGG